jgi:hypothetical protein
MSGGLDVDRVPDTTSCGRCSFTKEVAPVATRIAHELDSVRLGASWSVRLSGHPGDLGKLPPRTGGLPDHLTAVSSSGLDSGDSSMPERRTPRRLWETSERASIEHDRGVAFPGSCRGAPEELDPLREARPGPRSIVGGETVVASATRRSASTLAAPRGQVSKATAASSAYEQGAENARMIGVPVSVDHGSPCYA